MNYSALEKTYNTLSHTNQLRVLLNSFFKSDKYSNYSKIELIEVVNKTLMKNYEGERILKYQLANEFVNKKYIAAFEVKAKNSRTDFLVINGDTKSFEVKSKIDTLNRLSKQSVDYSDVFEYNTVVIDYKHLKNVENLLPDYYGIWYFDNNKKIIYREARYSPNINPHSQLGLFTKKELSNYFGTTDIDNILRIKTSIEINQALKDTLKKRYNDRWLFLQNNWSKIYPIDIQFFFNTNVKPEIIYS